MKFHEKIIVIMNKHLKLILLKLFQLFLILIKNFTKIAKFDLYKS